MLLVQEVAVKLLGRCKEDAAVVTIFYSVRTHDLLSEKNDGGTSTSENQATGNVSGTINVRGSEVSYKEAVVQGRL